jgi:hypothetical protein
VGVKVNACRVKTEIIYQATPLRIGFVGFNSRMIHGIGVYRPAILADINGGGKLVDDVLPEVFQVGGTGEKPGHPNDSNGCVWVHGWRLSLMDTDLKGKICIIPKFFYISNSNA